MSIYFPDEDIKSLDLDFVEMLDQARRLSGVTFYLFHRMKSDAQNRKDIDLRCEDDHARFHMVRALLNAGFNRIGVYPDFIHVEYDAKPINRMWLEKSYEL